MLASENTVREDLKLSPCDAKLEADENLRNNVASNVNLEKLEQKSTETPSPTVESNNKENVYEGVTETVYSVTKQINLDDPTVEKTAISAPSPSIGQDLIKTPSSTKEPIKKVPFRRPVIKRAPKLNLIRGPRITESKKAEQSSGTISQPESAPIQPEVVSLSSTEDEKRYINDGLVEPVAASGDKGDLCENTVLEVEKQPIKQPEKQNVNGGIVESVSPAELPSPIKQINRARIRAIPVLGPRGVSVSTSSLSESEDDAHKRTRLNSTSETVPSSAASTINSSPRKEYNSVVQRKCRRSEQSRKLADAKRQFHNKFGNQEPDRNKLTMLDLIFYNPVSNPMPNSLKKESKKRKASEMESAEIPDDPVQEEPEPEPEPEIEEPSLPTPQIKIGEDGEIVLDETSLYVENTSLKRRRAEIEKSEAFDADLGSKHFYLKKAKRSKDWTDESTLLFYKALNTLGCDFTSMVQFFPNRTRKELKMKFRKEDKINPTLVDRALKQPVEYNFKELKLEIEKRQKEAEERAEKAKQVHELVIPSRALACNGIKPSKVLPTARSRLSKKKHSIPVKPKPNTVYSKLSKGFTTILGSDSESGSENKNDKDEIKGTLSKSTWSGRISKVIQTNDASNKPDSSEESSSSQKIESSDTKEKTCTKVRSVDSPSVDTMCEEIVEASKETDDSSDDEEEYNTQNLLRPTRSGRIPKPTKTFKSQNYEDSICDSAESLESNQRTKTASRRKKKLTTNSTVTPEQEKADENEILSEALPESSPTHSEAVSEAPQEDFNVPISHINLAENPPSLEPGSILILTTVLPSGEDSYQLYMVPPKADQLSTTIANTEVTNSTTVIGNS